MPALLLVAQGSGKLWDKAYKDGNRRSHGGAGLDQRSPLPFRVLSRSP